MNAWMLAILAWATAAAGVATLGWALFNDRSRGRRRCPRCWYDMTGAVGLTCPECGKTAKRERSLLRTRRRWRWAIAGMGAALLGAAVGLGPVLSRQPWVASAPRPVLIAAIWFTGGTEERLTSEFIERITPSPSGRPLGVPSRVFYTSNPVTANSAARRPTAPVLIPQDLTAAEKFLLRSAMLRAWPARADWGIERCFVWLGPDAAPAHGPLVNVYLSDDLGPAARTRTLELLLKVGVAPDAIADACVRTAVGKGDAERRTEALRMVRSLRGRAALAADPRLLALIRDPARPLRSVVVDTVGAFVAEDTGFAEEIARVARTDPDAGIRRLAMSCLLDARRGCRRWAPVFLEVHDRDDSPTVRASSLFALRLCGCDGATLRARSLASLDDAAMEVRLQALMGLRSLGTDARDCAGRVRAALRDPDPEVARVAAEVLEVIDPGGSGEPPAAQPP